MFCFFSASAKISVMPIKSDVALKHCGSNLFCEKGVLKSRLNKILPLASSKVGKCIIGGFVFLAIASIFYYIFLPRIFPKKARIFPEKVVLKEDTQPEQNKTSNNLNKIVKSTADLNQMNVGDTFEYEEEEFVVVSQNDPGGKEYTEYGFAASDSTMRIKKTGKERRP